MSTEKILLDTDIGCDIDDAICLAYLLAHPRCELMGITTVNGDTRARAQLASALCLAARRNVPIFPGVKDTLLARRARKPVPQAEALSRLPHGDRFDENGYLEFMRDMILEHPGEVTLLAIGPMTNVGLLFAAYPDTARALKRLVLMGGTMCTPASPATPFSRRRCPWRTCISPTARRSCFSTIPAPPLRLSTTASSPGAAALWRWSCAPTR